MWTKREKRGGPKRFFFQHPFTKIKQTKKPNQKMLMLTKTLVESRKLSEKVCPPFRHGHRNSFEERVCVSIPCRAIKCPESIPGQVKNSWHRRKQHHHHLFIPECLKQVTYNSLILITTLQSMFYFHVIKDEVVRKWFA